MAARTPVEDNQKQQRHEGAAAMEMDGQVHSESGNEVWGEQEKFLPAGGDSGYSWNEKAGSSQDRYRDNKDKQSFYDFYKQALDAPGSRYHDCIHRRAQGCQRF